MDENTARPATGIPCCVAGAYASYTLEMSATRYESLYTLHGYPLPGDGSSATIHAEWLDGGKRVRLYVQEEENIRRAILVARYVTLHLGYAAFLPHVQGQAIYGADSPAVRERVLPDCVSVVHSICRPGDDEIWEASPAGKLVAISREDGRLYGGTATEFREASALDADLTYKPWFEWAADLRAAGVDPDEPVETVWSLRRERDALAAHVHKMDSWDGLMHILDKHYPADLPSLRDVDSRDPGPRINGLLAWVHKLKGRVSELEAERDRWWSEALSSEELAVSVGLSAMDADNEASRLRKRVTELEAGAAPIEWREGVPSVVDVQAHEAQGGEWQACRRGTIERVDFFVPEDDTVVWVVDGRPGVGDEIAPFTKYGKKGWAFRPADRGTPAPWPVHDTITTDVLDSEPVTGPRLEPVELEPLADGVEAVDTDLCISTTASGDCEGVADVQ